VERHGDWAADRPEPGGAIDGADALHRDQRCAAERIGNVLLGGGGGYGEIGPEADQARPAHRCNAEGRGIGASEQLGGGAAARYIDEYARTKRPFVEGGAVCAHREFVLDAADDVAKNTARQNPTCGMFEVMKGQDTPEGPRLVRRDLPCRVGCRALRQNLVVHY
jgi:hypothetical protein